MLLKYLKQPFVLTRFICIKQSLNINHIQAFSYIKGKECVIQLQETNPQNVIMLMLFQN